MPVDGWSPLQHHGDVHFSSSSSFVLHSEAEEECASVGMRLAKVIDQVVKIKKREKRFQK